MSCIESYIEHDLALIPIPRGQKGPNTSGWNERGKAIVDRIRAASITGNVGLAHQYCKRPTMALDIDDLAGSRIWFKEHHIDLDALLNAGDLEGATRERASYRMWMIATVALGLVCNVAPLFWIPSGLIPTL